MTVQGQRSCNSSREDRAERLSSGVSAFRTSRPQASDAESHTNAWKPPVRAPPGPAAVGTAVRSRSEFTADPPLSERSGVLDGYEPCYVSIQNRANAHGGMTLNQLQRRNPSAWRTSRVLAEAQSACLCNGASTAAAHRQLTDDAVSAPDAGPLPAVLNREPASTAGVWQACRRQQLLQSQNTLLARRVEMLQIQLAVRHRLYAW